MEHLYIENNDIIEKYVLQQLSSEEETALEEHLLHCEKCRNELDALKKIYAVGQKGIFNPVLGRHKFKPQRSIKPFLRYAAIFIIILGIGAIILNQIHNHKEGSYNLAEENDIDSTIVDSTKVKPELAQEIMQDDQTKKAPSEQEDKKDDKELYAEAFIPSPYFEEMVMTHYRGSNIKVQSPHINDTLLLGKKILFQWSSQKYDSLLLVIFNNKDVIFFEEKIGKSLLYNPELFSGLYYWQLESAEEALYIGKYYIVFE